MIKIILSFMISLLFLSAGFAEVKITGKFRLVKAVTYQSTNQVGNYETLSYDESGKLSFREGGWQAGTPNYRYVYDYDNTGRKIKVTNKDSSGKVKEHITFAYIDKKLININKFNEKNTLSERTYFNYNKTGNLIIKTIESIDYRSVTKDFGLQNVFTYSYLANGLMYQEMSFEKGVLRSMTNYRYSGRTKDLIQEYGNWIYYTTYTYDNLGRLITKYVRDKGNDRCSTYTARYEYDRIGNLTKVSLYNNQNKLSYYIVFTWEAGVFDQEILTEVLSNMIRWGC